MGIHNQRVSSLLLWILLTLGISHAKVHYKVRCTEDTMQVEVVKTESTGDVYLDQLKNYPDRACHPEVDEHRAVFRLSLKDVFQCGVTRIANQVTGRRAYYHRIVIETKDQNLPKEVILVKCIQSGLHNRTHLVTKRNVLPAGFQEPEFKELELFDMVARAPEPMLGVGVRQGGQLVTGELNVNPGTPLQMEIYLDKGSAPVYGLLVSYMQVSDTKAQEETIIFNGCSVDPYLFENFNTVDGDFLSAKFRAFKFPESTYVQFKGTVNVCLDKCRGVECSNGQLGFGRRRREVPNTPADPNKVFEVTMTTFIKVDYKDDGMLEKGKLGGASVIKSTSEFGKIRNETKIDASSGSSGMTHDGNRLQQLETEEIREEFKYTVVEADGNAASVKLVNLSLFLLMSVFIFH